MQFVLKNILIKKVKISLFETKILSFRGVAQLVARVVWDHQAAGSNPVTPTTSPQAAYRLRRLFYKSAHFAASPFPKKVMLRLRCSLVNALLTVSLATNLLQVYVSINFFDGIFFITSLHF